MAFDGITISCLKDELRNTLLQGRIYKIAQPEKDELLLTIKTSGGQHRLVISASASLPLVYLTDKNKPSPLTAPGFCMLLRKHLQNGRITDITQPSLERILIFTIEHLDEMGDLCKKKLIVELMGKHSNIIFCKEDGTILDSIKHISSAVSSLREVLPGREYFIPETSQKADPLSTTKEEFFSLIYDQPADCFKALYSSYTGLSPFMAHELCYRGGGNCQGSSFSLTQTDKESLYLQFTSLMEQIKEGNYQPVILYEHNQPKEYSAVLITSYPLEQCRFISSISALLEQYYEEKSVVTRIRQKSVDLRKIVQTALERNIKKYDLQLRQMEDTKKRETYKVYGELLTAYGYQVPQGSKNTVVNNYYTGVDITIPLDPDLSAIDNAKKYFEKYNKLKRTYEALSTLTVQVKEEIDHLESISNALDIALKEEDLIQIKEELMETGYIKRKGNTKKQRFTSKPFHYVSSDGFHMYVGKNNYQNEELTFKFASGNDWWFHAKSVPGSHVIVKAEGRELTDLAFEEAGKLAAYYSKGRDQEKIEIDYTLKKNIKKPAGAKPGFVVYYTNYSLFMDADISALTLIE
ncbi:MAG: NFACT family protein [Lachnospiraceae bacterium]|nr:NFACT family protein [Lachnospiraceae bacterium]